MMTVAFVPVAQSSRQENVSPPVGPFISNELEDKAGLW